MAESTWPLNFSGGNVIGIRRMVLWISCSPNSFQNGTLLRRISTSGLPSGISLPNSLSVRSGGRTFELESSGV